MSGHEQLGRVELSLDRTRNPHRPGLHHPKLQAVANAGHDVGDGELSGLDLRHLALCGVRRDHHPVRVRVLLDLAEDIARTHTVPLLHLGDERPPAGAVERVHDDPAGDEVPLRFPDLVERALDPIVDAAEHAGPELQRQWGVGRHHRLTDVQAGRILIDLDERRLAVEPDDLADQFLFADADDVVHPRAGQPPRDHRRAGDPCDDAAGSCHAASSRA